MNYITYTLQGNHGTVLEVRAGMNDHNVTITAEMYIRTLAPNAPEMYGDILTHDEELITGRCIDGDMKAGHVWSTAIEDGELTHLEMATDPVWSEIFVCRSRTETPTANPVFGEPLEYQIAGDYIPALMYGDYSALSDDEQTTVEQWEAQVIHDEAHGARGHWAIIDDSTDNWKRCAISGTHTATVTVAYYPIKEEH